ncbi:MobC family plasmid mobilization relaxosome protein [Enterococcus lactis]|uniref:MobC family plasmid mobilization relaxosome protein n=1 Tax=Enterococcus lactis TaxID=357441 RepID=UPI00376F6D95
MVYRYRTNLKKVFLTDSELHQLNERIGNNINQIARAINQSHLISQEQLQELSKGVGELIKEVDREFQVEVKRLKEFHGSH